MSTTQPLRPAVRGFALMFACCFAVGPAAAAEAAAKAGKPAVKAARKAPAAAAEPALADAAPEQVKAAEMVYYGVYDCEFKQTLHIVQSPKHSAYVDVKSGKSGWLMRPVLSSTGAIRLEDVRGETLMVQISSKSMLLNVKTAQRIVDDCISPRQRQLIEEARAAKASAEAAPAKAQADGVAPAASAVAAEVATAPPK